MRLIVGLGNPGEKYKNNRHNLGFMVVDEFIRKLEPEVSWHNDKKFFSQIAKISNQDLMVAKPQTFMNSSGKAVKKLTEYFKIEFCDIWVIHDELDLPLGSLKIQFGRGGAGHKGVDSIIKSQDTSDFIRFRVGVGKPETGDSEKYLLSDFGTNEKSLLKKTIRQTIEAITLVLDEGISQAMNKFN